MNPNRENDKNAWNIYMLVLLSKTLYNIFLNIQTGDQNKKLKTQGGFIY